MKKQKVFLLFASLTALLFCGCSSELKEKENASSKPGTVTLSIANDTQRTISPASGISYKNVSEWIVTFEDITESRSEKYNDIVKTVSFSESANQQIQLPLGTYAVIFEGAVTKQATIGDETSEASTEPQTVHFYGESTVTVEDGKSASVSVFVSPKKTGTGSFFYAINISGIEDYPPAVDGDTNTTNHFTATLIPYAQSEKVSLTASVKKGITDNSYILTVTNTTVPSGFYKLSIEYEWKTGEDEDGSAITDSKEVFYPYHDFLVEITDDLKTTGETSLTISIENSKTYYATTGESKGNGAFKSYPKKLDALLDDINSTTISTANIYLVDEATAINSLEIDISKIKSNIERNIFAQNENGGMYQVYSVNLDNDLVPTITLCNDVNFVTLTSISDTFKKANLIYTQTEQIYCTLKKDTSIIIDNPTTDKIKIENTEYNSYYAEHPCVTVKNSSYDELTVSVDKDLENTYTVVTKTSTDGADTITEYYIIPSATASSGVTGIPAYSLAVTRDGVDVTTSTLLYAGDTVVITAAPAAEGAFTNGTTFAWFVNGKQVECTEQTYTITFGQDDAGATNSIICLVGYNGEYASAGTSLTAAEQTVLLYTERGLGYAELASLNVSTVTTDILDTNTSYTISDFCIDTKTNDAYLIYTNGSNTLIRKATYNHNSTEHYVVADYTSGAATGLIKMGNDDKLYVRLDGEDDGNLLGIVTLSSDDSTSTANVTKITNPSEFSESTEILSFCVDSNGIVYATYKSGEDIILASFANTDNSLKIIKSITLATISSTDNSVTSNYLPANISSNITITDMHYEDDYIYLIVRDTDCVYYTSKDKFHSLGGVCKIKADNLTLADSSNPLIGWADTSVTTTSSDGNTIYTYKHAENETSNQYYFYGPQKIIAIKPKEIVIADDGAAIGNKNGNDNKMIEMNRAVILNLEKNSITGVKTAPTEFFFSTSADYSPNES